MSPRLRAVFVDLCFTAKELQHERFLDALHAEDGGCNAAREQIIDVFGTSDFFDFRLLFFGDDDFFERNVLPLKGMDAQEDVEHRCVLAALSLRADEQHTVSFDTVAGIQTPCEVLLTDAEDAFGLDAALHLLREFLEFNELGVDEMGFLLHEEETRLPFGPAAASIDLDAFNRLDEFLFVGLVDLHLVIASSALEHRRVKTGRTPVILVVTASIAMRRPISSARS